MLAFFTLNSTPLTRDVTSFKLQRYGENKGGKKLSVEHTLNIGRLADFISISHKKMYLQT